jgi:FkbM family methyltransferase
MKRGPAEVVKRVLGRFGVGLTNYRYLQELKTSERARYSLDFLQHIPEPWVARSLRLIDASPAQFHQDLFVLAATGFARDGYFVEFGATDGVELSNTMLLEREFGWSGILAEPARCWQQALRQNRACTIESRCVWTRSGETLTFNEVDYAELSTIQAFSGNDTRKRERERGRNYSVETIPLNDLLAVHGAPAVIDYLSIDTEGSELDILEAFDFTRHRFRVITCEHNYSPAREKIHTLLTGHGYRRCLTEISTVDDWYVSGDIELPTVPQPSSS